MELPLIVLIDPEARKIFIYGQYNREFLLEEMYIVKAFLEGKNVMYVTQATECSGDELIATAEAIMEQLPPQEPPKRFFRINGGDGYTTIPEYKIRFAGKKDAKPVEMFGENVFEKSPRMRQLLMDNKLEVISEEEVAALKKRRPNEPVKGKSILLDKKEDVLYGDDMFNDENEVKADEEVETDEDIALKKGFGRS